MKPEAKIGDYVVVGAKFVMEIIPEKKAKEAIKLWKSVESK